MPKIVIPSISVEPNGKVPGNDKSATFRKKDSSTYNVPVILRALDSCYIRMKDSLQLTINLKGLYKTF